MDQSAWKEFAAAHAAIEGPVKYLAVRRILREAAARGVWAAGERLPSVRQIAADLHVGLGCVKRAVESLVDGGELESAPRRGVFVPSLAALGHWNRFQRFQLKGGRLIRYEPRLLVFDRAECPEAARALDLPADTRFVHAVRRLNCEGTFLSLDEIFLHPGFFGGLSPEHLSTAMRGRSLYGVYEEELGVRIAHAADTICARPAGEEFAEFGLAPGDALLQILRVARLADGRAVEHRRVCADARRVQFRAGV